MGMGTSRCWACMLMNKARSPGIVAERALGLGVTYQLAGQAELRVTRLAQFLSWLD